MFALALERKKTGDTRRARLLYRNCKSHAGLRIRMSSRFQFLSRVRQRTWRRRIGI